MIIKMLYLLMGILSFSYFYKKWGLPVFVESKKITILNLLTTVVIILIWPAYVVSEIIIRILHVLGIRGEE